MAEVPLIKQILDLYPRFFTKSPKSNHVKYNTALSTEYLNLIREAYVVSLATRLDRPLKLWKEQTIPNTYTMKYEVGLTDIKQVKLYKDNSLSLTGDEILDNNLNELGVYKSPNILDIDDNIIATFNGSDILDINGKVIATVVGDTINDINGNIITIINNDKLYDTNLALFLTMDEIVEPTNIELIHDSGILPLGTDTYSGSYATRDDINIIPKQKYFIEVTDYHENRLEKGYPENDIPAGDIYDHDEALDTIGINNITPRRKYPNSNLLTEDTYANTYPPYFLNETEADYWFEERLRIEEQTYGKLPLAATEIFKYLGVYPDNHIMPDYPVGRWRQVCKMGTGNPDDQFCGDVMGTLNGNVPTEGCKHIRTENWNSSTFDVWVDVRKIPSNIAFSEPTEDVLQTIIDRSFSLGKKAFLQYTLSETMSESIGTVDELIGITGMGFKDEGVTPNELLTVDALNLLGESVGVNEGFSFNIHEPLLEDTVSISESMKIYEDILQSVSDEAGFNLGSYYRTAPAYWNGIPYVGVNATPQDSQGILGVYTRNDGGRSHCGTLMYFQNVVNWDTNSYCYAQFDNSTSTTKRTDWLTVWGFNAGIPSDAHVIGWKVGVATASDYQSSGRQVIVRVRRYSDNAYVDHSLTVPASSKFGWHTVYINGAGGQEQGSNLWEMNGLTLGANDVNGNMGISFYTNNVPQPNPYTVRFAYVYLQVFYQWGSGLYTTKVFSKPNNAHWNGIYINAYEPSYGMTNTALYGDSGAVRENLRPYTWYDISDVTSNNLVFQMWLAMNASTTGFGIDYGEDIEL